MDLEDIGGIIFYGAVITMLIFGIRYEATKPERDAKEYDNFIHNSPYQEIHATYEGVSSDVVTYCRGKAGPASYTVRSVWFKLNENEYLHCECNGEVFTYFSSPFHKPGEDIVLRHYDEPLEVNKDSSNYKKYEYGMGDYTFWDANIITQDMLDKFAAECKG